jgi:hypothetical protein
MAVQDKYTDSNISGNVVNKLLKAINAHGAQVHAMYATFEVAAADDDGSKYRVFKNLDPNLIPLGLFVGNDALTAGTDYGLGLYKPDLGAVINKDAFAAGMDMSVAAASLNPKTAKDGMAAVAIENYGKRLFEHAGHDITNKLEAYDLVFTADTAGTAAGTISVLALFAQG